MNGNGTPKATGSRREKFRVCLRASGVKPRLRVDPQGEMRLEMEPDFRTKQE